MDTLMQDTSLAAFASIKPHASSIEEAIMREIENAPKGLTLDDIASKGWLLQTVCGRVLSLRNRGLVQDSGERRRTRSGRKAIVWEHVGP